MTTQINYNSVTFELDVKCSNNTMQESLEAEIKENNGKRITDWIESFLERLKEENNNESFCVAINSCDEYEKDFIRDILKKEIDIKCEIKVFTKAESERKYKDIDAIIDFVLKSNDDIVKRAINPHKKNINLFRNNKVEVPVIATMSSGKSTLLNALIGQDFLHEDTGATTATTCTIKVNNNLERFKASFENKEGEKESTETNISDFIKNKNKQSNEDQSIELFLEGPVTGLDTQGFDFYFIDTPGPNSAKNEHHKEKTFTFLKDNQNLPIVLYVLDPEKMDSKDDDTTLNEIGEILKENKQNLERIVFVYNKIDREDIDKKTMQEIIDKIKNFLKEYNITKPKIFPISAEYAKLAQLKELSRKKKIDLQNYQDNFHPVLEENYKGYELLEHSPLTASQKETLRKRIDNSEVDKDLVYSGLAALKFYIEDYVTNHHLKKLYKELHSITNSVFVQIREEIRLERGRLENYSEEQRIKQKKREEEELKMLSNQQASLKKSIIAEKINREFVKSVIHKVDDKFDSLYDQTMRKDELSPQDAEKLLNEINTSLKNLKFSIKTTLDSKMKDEIEKYVTSLKKIAANKFEINDNKSATVSSFKAEMLNNINSINLNQIEKYQEKKTETKTRIVKRSTLIGQFFLGSKTEEYQQSRTVVNPNTLYKNAIDPKRKEFANAINNCENHIQEVEDNLKTEFNKSIEKFSQDAKVRVYKKASEFRRKDIERKEKAQYFSQLEEKFKI